MSNSLQDVSDTDSKMKRPIDFTLFVTPPKKLFDDDSKTLHQLNLVPAAIIMFSSTDITHLTIDQMNVEQDNLERRGFFLKTKLISSAIRIRKTVTN